MLRNSNATENHASVSKRPRPNRFGFTPPETRNPSASGVNRAAARNNGESPAGRRIPTRSAVPPPGGAVGGKRVAPAPIAEDGSEKENGRAAGPVVPKRERRVLPGAGAGRPPAVVKHQPLRKPGPASNGISPSTAATAPPAASAIGRHVVLSRPAAVGKPPSRPPHLNARAGPSGRQQSAPKKPKAAVTPKPVEVMAVENLARDVTPSTLIEVAAIPVDAAATLMPMPTFMEVACQVSPPFPAEPEPEPPPESLGATAAEEVPRECCSGCSAKDEQLGLAREELEAAGLKFAGLGVLFKHLAFTLDGFSSPGLKQRLLAAEISIQQLQLENNASREREATLRAVHELEMKRLQEEFSQETEENFARAEKVMESRVAMATQHCEAQVSDLRAVLTKSEEERERVVKELEVVKKERDDLWAESELSLGQRVEARVQAVQERGRLLEQETASMKSILDMQTTELNSLRRDKELWKRKDEELREAEEQLKRVKREKEDLRGRLDAREAAERELLTEKQTLEESLNRLRYEKTMATQERDMLRWKVQNSREGGNGSMNNGNCSNYSRSGTPVGPDPPTGPLVRTSSFRVSHQHGARSPMPSSSNSVVAVKKNVGPLTLPATPTLPHSPSPSPSTPVCCSTSGCFCAAPATSTPHPPGHPRTASTSTSSSGSPSPPPPSGSVPSSLDSPGLRVLTEKDMSVSFIVSFDCQRADNEPISHDSGSRHGTPHQAAHFFPSASSGEGGGGSGERRRRRIPTLPSDPGHSNDRAGPGPNRNRRLQMSLSDGGVQFPAAGINRDEEVLPSFIAK